MLKVLFKLIVMQPQLLLTHAQNYGDLLVEGWQQALASWKYRLLLYLLSATCLVMGFASGAGTMPYPNGPDSGLYLTPLHVFEAAYHALMLSQICSPQSYETMLAAVRPKGAES